MLTEELEERLGQDAERHSVAGLFDAVIEISCLEQTDPAGWSIATDRLVRILRSERNRIDRIESWNKRKDQK